MTDRAAVLLDVDGTLVDSVPQHVVAWWKAFRDVDRVVATSDVTDLIGLGSTELVQRLLDSSGGGADDEDLVGRLKNAHTHYYGPWLEQLVPLPGAVDLLRRCADAGLVVVLTSSASDEEKTVLQRVLADGLDVVTEFLSSEDVEGSKPEPDAFDEARRAAGTEPGRSVGLGDAVWDVRSAQAAGVPCLGVLSGGASEQQLRDEGALEVHRGVADLLEAFDGSALGRLARGESLPTP